MRYGHFEDARREYVVTTPHTPAPWINYLGTEDFFGIISQQAGGYCFFRDARLRRVLRYRYNNVPTDMGGRYFYIHEDGDVWTPSHMPCKAKLDEYECRHGLGYTKISSSRNDLRVEATYLIPRGHSAEIHRVRLRNQSGRRRKFKLFSYVEFCLWNAVDDMTNLQRNLNTGEVEIEGSAIYHCTEYRERRNHYAFYSVNRELAGFDTDRESFLGTYNSPADPRAVLEGCSSQSHAHGWAPIASHCVEIELGPDEETSCIFVLGYVENPPEEKWAAPGVIDKSRARTMQAAFVNDAQVDAALDALREYWDEKLSHYQVWSPDERLDRMVNVWNQYQCMVTYHMSRSTSGYETGMGRGMGFRDSNQDILGFVHMAPEQARERLIDLAATMRDDGGAYHQYQPLTKRGNDAIGGGFNDDPLWIILAVCAYVKESGDYALLDVSIPFENDESKSDTMGAHLRRAFDHVINNRGPHGLPLIGRADWNDCLNLNCFSDNPDESYQTTANREGRVAESVMIAGLFVYSAYEYAALMGFVGRGEEAARATRLREEMETAVLTHGYDGKWFRRAYDYFGKVVGSDENDEGKIFIEPQGWCAMAGIGKAEGRTDAALESVRERLNTPYGVVLCDPAYTRYHLELGEISSYPPGYKENAAVFCHTNPWIMIAEALHGRGNRAYDYYKQIAPAFIEERSHVHRAEPYVYAQMIAGKVAARPGEAKNSWLTGTASWNFVAISQFLLGVRPDHNGLMVKPCIGTEVGRFRVTRWCRGAKYVIEVENAAGTGDAKLTVDGKAIDGNVIPYAPAGAVVRVQCQA